MRNLVLRLVVNGLAIAVVAALLPGITITNDGLGTLAILAVLIAIVNAFVRPIVMLLSCPFIILSLGILIPVINGLMLMLVASLSGERLVVDNFGWAIVGGIIMAIVVIVLESVLGLREDRRREPRYR